MKALREDLATLLKDTGSLASGQAKAAAARAKELAGEAGEKAVEFREAVATRCANIRSLRSVSRSPPVTSRVALSRK